MENIVNLYKGEVVTDMPVILPILSILPSESDLIVKLNDKILTIDKDYKLSDNSLILSANFLLTLPSCPLGEVAVVTCSSVGFSDIKIRVFQLNRSKISDEQQDKQDNDIQKEKKSSVVRLAIGGIGVMAIVAVTRFLRKRK